MKKMFCKLTAIGLSVALCAGALCGCGGGGSSDTAESNGKINISISGMPSEDTQPELYQTMMDKFARFEETYPDIHITGERWIYDTKTFAAKAEGGTLPTVYLFPFTETKKLRDNGYAVDITQLAKEYGFYDIISDNTMEVLSENGKLNYLPGDSPYALGLLINMNLFRQAGLVTEDDAPIIPQTYEELAETASIITEKTGQPGFLFPSTDNVGGWQFCVLAWAFGTKFISQEDGKYVASFDTPECVQALEYLKSLKWDKHTLPDNALINSGELQSTMASDRCGMCIGNTDLIQAIIIQHGMDMNDIAVAKLPAGPACRVTQVGGSYYSFAPNSTPEQLDAAFKWISFENALTKFDESARDDLVKTMDEEVLKGRLIGLKEVNVWNSNSKYQEYKDELIEEYRNVPLNHVADFNDQSGIEFRAEEPACTQDLYQLLDSCIQEILTSKDADCAALIQQANSDFQTNFLDYE